MPGRGYLIPALILWFGATGWLLTTKILPTFFAGSPPAYGDLLPADADEVLPVRWSIRWNRQEIGWAENRILRAPDGSGQVVSEVQFQQLPLDKLFGDLMGILGPFAKPLTGSMGPLDLRVLTHLDLDSAGRLSSFQTTADVGELPRLFEIFGRVVGDKLDVAANVQTEPETMTEIFRDREFHLPPDAFVADTFSPRPRFANLRVGQSWTFQSYRPLMPHRPLQLIEATVEQEELIDWGGNMVRAKKVVFRQDAGSGLSTTRQPISETWVLRDGTVLRQDVWVASLRIQFLRFAPGEASGAHPFQSVQRDVRENSTIWQPAMISPRDVRE